MTERINLPRHRIQNRQSINVEFTPRSFPRQRFALQMEWNSELSRWTVEIEHLTIGRRVTKSVATPYRYYSYLPFCVFLFADPSGEAQRVTPQNLQEEMYFYVIPGPDGRPPEEW